MNDQRLKNDRSVALLPWQAAAMVMAVTLAGLLHEHPEQMRPVLARVQASAVGVHAESLLDVIVHTVR